MGREGCEQLVYVDAEDLSWLQGNVALSHYVGASGISCYCEFKRAIPERTEELEKPSFAFNLWSQFFFFSQKKKEKEH